MKNELKTGFVAMAGALLAATPTQAFFDEAVNSNVAQVTLASTGGVIILQDADLPAGRWVRANPTGIAVSVRLGVDTEVPPQMIESVLRQDFASSRFSNLQFFFEQGTSRGTTVAYYRRNYVDGPFSLPQSRRKVAQVADQHQFEMANNLN